MSHWCQKVIDAVQRGGAGSLVVDFASYRPDLVEALAAALGCVHVDFRREVLAPLGFAAHTLPLAEIEAAAATRPDAPGLVLQNAEALLAAKSPAERLAWLTGFLAVPRDRLVVLPLALFGRELADHPRLVRLAAEDLPAESLLGQLASMRMQ